METEVAEDFEDGTGDVGEAGEEEDFRLLIRRYIKWLTLLGVMHSNPIVNNSKELVYLWSVTQAVRLEIFLGKSFYAPFRGSAYEVLRQIVFLIVNCHQRDSSCVVAVNDCRACNGGKGLWATPETRVIFKGHTVGKLKEGELLAWETREHA